MKKQMFIGLLMAAFGAGCASAPVSTPQPLPANTVQQSVTVSSTEPAAATTTAPVTAPPTAPAKTTTIKKPAPKPAPGPAVYTVLIQNFMYVPQVMAVKAGDAVLWVNKDNVNHTSASDGALIWDSGNIAPGQSYKRVFNAVGTYHYHCNIHSSMQGTIVVR